MVTWSMCMSAWTFFITSTGQGAPAMIPVRRLVRSNSPKRGCSSSAMNMVGATDRQPTSRCPHAMDQSSGHASRLNAAFVAWRLYDQHAQALQHGSQLPDGVFPVGLVHREHQHEDCS